MSFLDNVKKRLQKSQTSRRIDTDTLERLARTREALFYYWSIKRSADRRSFSTTLIDILDDFFKVCEDPIAREQIDNSIKASAAIQSVSNTESKIYAEVRAIQPEGYRLLEVNPPENLASIKDKWRSASKKYHPDMGGSTEQQQAVNEAYDLLQNFFTQEHQGIEVDEVDFRTENLESFLLKVFEIYLDVVGANYDCNRCVELAKGQLNFGIWSAGKGRLKDYVSIVQDLEFLMTEIKANPGTLKAEYCGELIIETTVRSVLYGFERARVGEIKVNAGEWWEKQKRKRKPENKIWVFRSIEQVSNAYKLGIINEDKYKKLSSKYTERSLTEERAFSAIQDYANRPGFTLDLGIYPVDLATAQTKEFVPEPMYFHDRFVHLDEDQQTEYLSMFKPPVKTQAIKKYLYQRLMAYCVASVKSFEKLDWNRILTEIKLLGEFGGSSSAYTSTYVVKLIEYFQSLPIGERKKRLGLLANMDTNDLPMLEITISFGGRREENQEHKKKITPDENYYSFAMLPFEKLELFKRTGNTLTKSEYVDEGNAMVSFNKSLDVLRDSPIGQQYWKCVVKGGKVSEEEKLAAYTAYLKEAKDISEKHSVTVAKYLDFDYLFDRVTVTQAKLKDWHGVIKSAEDFLSLSEELRTRGGSKAHMENINKRLVKAREAIAKTVN